MDASDTNEKRAIVAASELAVFAFCERAWRLQYVAGVHPGREQLARGTAAHGTHAARVFTSRRRLVAATVLALLALAGLVGAWLLLGGRP